MREKQEEHTRAKEEQQVTTTQDHVEALGFNFFVSLNFVPGVSGIETQRVLILFQCLPVYPILYLQNWVPDPPLEFIIQLSWDICKVG